MQSVALVGRLLLSLAVVLGLMWLIAKRMKRSGGRSKSGKLIELMSRQQLSRSASVAVVRVLDQALIVGITDGQVAVLGQADLDGAQEALTALETPKLAKALKVPKEARAARTKPARPARTAARKPTTRPANRAVLTPEASRNALSGSALSLNTWRQTLDSLRDLTARRT